MNSNDISPQNDAGLTRIKRISQFVRYGVLVNLVFSVCIFFVSFSRSSQLGLPEPSMRAILNIVLEGLVIFWFWELARLFRFYEQGLIFAVQPIRCIRKLGIICLCGWLTMVALNFIPHAATAPLPPGVKPGTLVVVTPALYDPFLSTPILFGRGFDFGLLVVGGSVVIAAWIMEEGRKMRAEQELTV